MGMLVGPRAFPIETDKVQTGRDDRALFILEVPDHLSPHEREGPDPFPRYGVDAKRRPIRGRDTSEEGVELDEVPWPSQVRQGREFDESPLARPDINIHFQHGLTAVGELLLIGQMIVASRDRLAILVPRVPNGYGLGIGE